MKIAGLSFRETLTVAYAYVLPVTKGFLPYAFVNCKKNIFNYRTSHFIKKVKVFFGILQTSSVKYEKVRCCDRQITITTSNSK